MKVKVKDPQNESVVDRAAYVAEAIFSETNIKAGTEYSAPAFKLNSAATDLVFYVAQGAATELDVTLYDWKYAKKSLGSLREVYKLFCKTNDIKVDPELMVKIDELGQEVDKAINDSKKAQQKRDEEELKPWMDKYKLWKEMNK